MINALDIVLPIYFRFKEMPLILCFFCVVGLLSMPLFILVLLGTVLFPCIPITFDGKEMTSSEFWQSPEVHTSIVYFVPHLVLLFVSGIAIFKKNKWSRVTLFVTFLSPLILGVLSRDIATLPIEDLIGAVFVYLFLFWYLFINESVRQYFRVSSGN